VEQKKYKVLFQKVLKELKLEFLTEAFAARGGRAISALMNAYDSGRGNLDEFTKALNDSTYAAEKMLQSQDTTAIKYEYSLFYKFGR
jgi:hypothetical protein